MFINSYSKPPSVIILDCDDTYGQQELALFNNYYNEYCYMPLHIYEGLSGKLITTILRPGRRSKQTNIARLLQKLISYLRAQWPETKIIVRGDSHFASQDFMDWTWIQTNVGFITGLAGNAKLHELAQVTIESARREFIHTLQKQVLKGSEYSNATMKTIQLKIIKTAAWVKEMKTKIKIELPQFCTTKKEQIKGYERLMALRT